MKPIKIPLESRILVPFFLTVVLLAVTMPRKGVFKYNWQKGGSWNYETLVAPFDFPILKTKEEINAETQLRLRAPYTSCYDYEPDVKDEVCARVGDALSKYPHLAARAVDFLTRRYAEGVMAPTHESSDLLSGTTENQGVIYIQKDKNCSVVPRDEVYLLSELCAGLGAELSSANPGANSEANPGASSGVSPRVNVDSLLEATSVGSILLPNLIFDRKLTEDKYRETSNPDDVAVTMGTFKAGDVIVRSGDAIRTYEDRLLTSYKAEFNEKVGYDGPIFLLWAGNLLLSLILSFIVVFVLLMVSPGTAMHLNEYLFILGLFVLCSGITFIMSRFTPSELYMIPYPVFALYLFSFFRRKPVIPLYGIFLLPVLIFCEGGMRMYITFFFAGCVAVLVFSHLNKGWQQFISALVIFASILLSHLAFTLVGGSFSDVEWMELLYIMLGSLFVVLAYPLVYLFEKVFNLVSESRLTELTDTNSPLLRSLSELAPGTFQHCIAVMNMVDAVGKDVDADIHLLRAAALYHDIGKMENAGCFIENQLPGTDFHANLSPRESARYIIGHVAAGLALARKNKLPEVISDFISTHHGTTSTGYFYNKYLNSGGDPSDVADFFYPGPRPQTKEQVVLMLCDSIEAASRTLSAFDYDTVSAFVDRIYEGKMQAGQYNGSDITLHELDCLKESLKQYLVHLHHGRIVYPERKNNDKQ